MILLILHWQNMGDARINADDFVLLAEYNDTLFPQLLAKLEQTAQKLDFLKSFSVVNFIFGAYQIKDKGELIKAIMDKANTALKTVKNNEQDPVVWYDERLLEKLRWELPGERDCLSGYVYSPV